MKWIVTLIKGYKTMGLGALLAILGGIQQSDLIQLVPPQYVGAVMSAVGVLVMVLRIATNTPLGSDLPSVTQVKEALTAMPEQKVQQIVAVAAMDKRIDLLEAALKDEK